MKPLTRKEFFMAKAAGQTVPDLEPITREEYFLNQIAENGGGGGGGGGGGSTIIVEIKGVSPARQIEMKAIDLFNACLNNRVFFHQTAETGYSIYWNIAEMSISPVGEYYFVLKDLDVDIAFVSDSADEWPYEMELK